MNRVPENSVRMLRQYSVDGVIVASSTLPPDFARAFREAGIPVVHSFGRASAAPVVHLVGIDNVDCGRMAARDADRRVAIGGWRFWAGRKRPPRPRTDSAGFLAEAATHPDVSVSQSFATAYSFDAGRAEMQRLLGGAPAEAYFCGDDVLSIGALSAIRDCGLSVPEDIGIIGLNDMEMARWQNINLTTIHQPIRQIVASSIDLMVAMLTDPDVPPEAVIYPCRVVERGTLRPGP